jgi:hypothetical protein
VKSDVFIGSYGLISLKPSETSKIIIDTLNSNALLRDSVGEQCLRFYYYFTVYDQQDWKQQIQILIRPNNETDDEFLIKDLTVAEMTNNKWEFQEVTFNSTFVLYTVKSFLIDIH